MKTNRREFLKLTSFTGLGVVSAGMLTGCVTRRERATESWQTDPRWQETKYGAWGGPGVDPRPGQMDDILLKDRQNPR